MTREERYVNLSRQISVLSEINMLFPPATGYKNAEVGERIVKSSGFENAEQYAAFRKAISTALRNARAERSAITSYDSTPENLAAVRDGMNEEYKRRDLEAIAMAVKSANRNGDDVVTLVATGKII